MAAVHSPPRQRRLRSASDPFVDPSPHTKPPPPPPKSATPHPTTTTKYAAPSSRTGGDITEAVRDTVTVRPQDRSKMNRSQTHATPSSSASNSRPSGRRSQSEDSGHIVEKPRNGKPRVKKGSQHADVIDRLDYTSVGPMFHHDGPFDACAPSRNKHRNKAPLYAWGDDPTAAQLGTGSAYPSAHAYAAFTNDYPDPPKKKVDALAEAWGIHEPEPFEDFSAGGGSGRLEDGDTPTSSIYNGRDSHTRPARRLPKENREKQRRSVLPPPQPIFVGDPVDFEESSGSPPASPGHPKRSRSIMQRIRKMRDAPNVPVGRDYEMPPGSPTSPVESARPTHRPQNSFLGRFAGGSRANPHISGGPEPFVFIEPTREPKDLPPAPIKEESTTPPTDNENSTDLDGQPTGGLGRKTSLIKKMGKVVRPGAK